MSLYFYMSSTSHRKQPKKQYSGGPKRSSSGRWRLRSVFLIYNIFARYLTLICEIHTIGNQPIYPMFNNMNIEPLNNNMAVSGKPRYLLSEFIQGVRETTFWRVRAHTRTHFHPVSTKEYVVLIYYYVTLLRESLCSTY